MGRYLLSTPKYKQTVKEVEKEPKIKTSKKCAEKERKREVKEHNSTDRDKKNELKISSPSAEQIAMFFS